MFHDRWARKYPLSIRIVDILCVSTQTSYCTTLCLHSFRPDICLSWFPLTMKYEGTELCSLKWLRLCWIQVSWLTGSCSNGVLAVHVRIGGSTSPPVTSCTGRVHSSHMVWAHLQAQEKHDFWSCVYYSDSWFASSGSGKKTPQARWKPPTGWAMLCCVTWYR